MPCLSTGLTTRAVPHFKQALQMGRRAAPKARGAKLAIAVMVTLCADRTMGEGAKRGKVSEVLFGARRRATARSATRYAARRRAKFSSARGGGRGRGGARSAARRRAKLSLARGGGRGCGGARSAARRGVWRVSAWAKALGREVCSPASWRCIPRRVSASAKARGLAALPTSGGLRRYWAAQWHLARAAGKRLRGCRAKRLYVH